MATKSRKRNLEAALSSGGGVQSYVNPTQHTDMTADEIKIAALQSRNNQEAGVGQKLANDNTRNTLLRKAGFDWFDVEDIIPNPDNDYAITEEDIEELADLIYTSKHVAPLTLRETAEGIQIIDGERRWRASKLLAQRYGDVWRMVPGQCYPLGFDEDRAAFIMDANNLGARNNISPSQAAKGYARMAERLEKLREKDPTLKGVKTKTWLAERFGVSERTAMSHLNIGRKLIEEGLRLWDEGKLTQGQAEEISRLSEEKQKLVVERLKGEKLTKEETDAIIQAVKNSDNGSVAIGETLTSKPHRELTADDHLKKAKKSIMRAIKTHQEPNLKLLGEVKELIREYERSLDDI